MPDKIELEKVCFKQGKAPLLREISFSVKRGDILVISGRSGEGKSTLLEICVGLKRPSSGRVLWDGQDISSFSRRVLLEKRQSTGYVFQIHALISNHSVFENIALPLRVRSGITDKEIEKRVRKIMDEFCLENIDGLFPELLSAGQLKSVAVARALISEPDMLLLDEPLSGLDPFTARKIMNVIYEHQNRRKMSVIMVSHETDIWEGFLTVKKALDKGWLVDSSEQEGVSGRRVHKERAGVEIK